MYTLWIKQKNVDGMWSTKKMEVSGEIPQLNSIIEFEEQPYKVTVITYVISDFPDEGTLPLAHETTHIKVEVYPLTFA